MAIMPLLSILWICENLDYMTTTVFHDSDSKNYVNDDNEPPLKLSSLLKLKSGDGSFLK